MANVWKCEKCPEGPHDGGRCILDIGEYAIIDPHHCPYDHQSDWKKVKEKKTTKKKNRLPLAVEIKNEIGTRILLNNGKSYVKIDAGCQKCCFRPRFDTTTGVMVRSKCKELGFSYPTCRDSAWIKER